MRDTTKKRLTSKSMMDATLHEHKLRLASETVDVLLQVAELGEKVKVFEAVIWFPRLQSMVNGNHARGMSGSISGIDVMTKSVTTTKIMTWCCAGRCLIQLERDGHRITLITADDEKPWNRDMAHVAPGMGPMGIQSIDADFIEALKILYEATRYGGEIVLTDDDKVTIG